MARETLLCIVSGEKTGDEPAADVLFISCWFKSR